MNIFTSKTDVFLQYAGKPNKHKDIISPFCPALVPSSAYDVNGGIWKKYKTFRQISGYRLKN